ncbi:MAG: metallophosphoesterase, partial [bacterium]
MKKFVFITLLWVSVIWSFNGFSQQSISTGSAEIIILHTNDMHSKIDNMAKLAYLSDSLRKLHPYVFLVAAGDNFTGNPVVDMLEDKGNPMINLMNLCGFNATAIGNHEFDMGQELLNKRMDQARFSFISCNIKVEDAILKQPKPYVLLNAGKDITIALLGATELNDKGIPDTHPSKLT